MSDQKRSTKMSEIQSTVEKRVAEAHAALLSELKNAGDDSEVTEYIEHHLDELEEGYWSEVCGASNPSVSEVAAKLTVQPFWLEEALQGEADLDRVDFTLPRDVTDYVLCVEYSEDGDFQDIRTES